MGTFAFASSTAPALSASLYLRARASCSSAEGSARPTDPSYWAMTCDWLYWTIHAEIDGYRKSSNPARPSREGISDRGENLHLRPRGAGARDPEGALASSAGALGEAVPLAGGGGGGAGALCAALALRGVCVIARLRWGEPGARAPPSRVRTAGSCGA